MATEYNTRGTVTCDDKGVISMQASFNGLSDWFLNKFTRDTESNNPSKICNLLFIIDRLQAYNCDIELTVKKGLRVILNGNRVTKWVQHDETIPFLMEHHFEEYNGKHCYEQSNDGTVTIVTQRDKRYSASTDSDKYFTFDIKDLIGIKGWRRMVDDTNSMKVIDVVVGVGEGDWDTRNTIEVTTLSMDFIHSLFQLTNWDTRKDFIQSPIEEIVNIGKTRKMPKHVISDVWEVDSLHDLAMILALKRVTIKRTDGKLNNLQGKYVEIRSNYGEGHCDVKVADR